VGLGPVSVAPGTVVRIVSHHTIGLPRTAAWSAADDAIIWQVRLPRVLLGAAVGAALAVVGVALQALVRNVLADPYVLGVTSGASTGAAAAILFGVGAGLGAGSLSVTAFAGAMLASVAVLAIARLGGPMTPTRVLLAGVAVGYLLHAATSFLIFASDSPEGTRAVMFWLLGSLAHATWPTLGPVVVVAVGAVGVLQLWGRRLDAIAIGDETARTLGVDPFRFRAQVLVVGAVAVGAVVAMSGGIGFVGLVIPHLARRLVGPGHRSLVPAAALIGAAFLVWSDVLARLLLQPRELPIGVVTALAGGPFLLHLVRRVPTAA
jgi:iron complex transport system permease protein